MDLRISKKTAVFLQKAISFYFFGYMNRETGGLDKENMEVLEVTAKNLEDLSKLSKNIDKQLKTK